VLYALNFSKQQHTINLNELSYILENTLYRYALDVNISSLDVLNHKRLLDSARSDPSAVSFQVRPVDVVSGLDAAKRPSFGSLDVASHASLRLGQFSPLRSLGHRPLPRPAFGSSPNLQALVLEAEERLDASSTPTPANVFYEVTIASIDQPKLLSRLSESLSDLGLNICEAHAFNTKDRFALDVFVVNGWVGGGTEDLEDVLSGRLQELPPPNTNTSSTPANTNANANANGPCLLPATTNSALKSSPARVFEQRVPPEELAELQKRALSGTTAETGSLVQSDDWEVDPHEVAFQEKVASGAFGDLFRGSYCGQDVAIKILRGVQDDSVQFQEFLQEVAIMRKVRHRNVVQFIGACTRRPNFCIVFEYMKGGSLYDYVRRAGPLRITTILRIAVEVCKGMDYLHKRKIVHRDLKAANLLLDEHGTIKIADFGVARVLDGAGVMTAETGTYRWMAPEVIEHRPYSEKADVFSFGVVLWELLTGLVPYNDMTPLQAAVGVVQKGLRPPIPQNCPPPLADIMRLCWQRDPNVRPSFEVLKSKLEELYEVYRRHEEDQSQSQSLPQGGGGSQAKPKVGTGGGLLSRLRSASGSARKS
jgi:serine/threonine protein kinase